VYGKASSVLGKYLAECLMSIRQESSSAFVFVLEDLTASYGKPPRVGGWKPGVTGLHDLHTALAQAAGIHGSDSLLAYDASFSQDLTSYARGSIAQFRGNTGSSEAGEILDNWSNLTRTYLSPEFDLPELHRPVHGDYNTGNVFFSIRDLSEFRVVDWEWAGVGLPHMDLASYLRNAPPEVTTWAIADFARRTPEVSLRTHERLLDRCALERAIWDASLLAAQLSLDPHRSQRLEQGITRALSAALAAWVSLSG
jgi:aminoglycoside phosphotransferase (APT) family kinase protein